MPCADTAVAPAITANAASTILVMAPPRPLARSLPATHWPPSIEAVGRESELDRGPIPGHGGKHAQRRSLKPSSWSRHDDRQVLDRPHAGPPAPSDLGILHRE